MTVRVWVHAEHAYMFNKSQTTTHTHTHTHAYKRKLTCTNINSCNLYEEALYRCTSFFLNAVCAALGNFYLLFEDKNVKQHRMEFLLLHALPSKTTLTLQHSAHTYSLSYTHTLRLQHDAMLLLSWVHSFSTVHFELYIEKISVISVL